MILLLQAQIMIAVLSKQILMYDTKMCSANDHKAPPNYFLWVTHIHIYSNI